MTVWRILGRAVLQPPQADWRTALATRLGQRPRRIGAWAELALAGALACLDQAGESRLPDAALLSLCSLTGPETALLGALENIRSELPMPIGFLQSQPGQVLPVLAQHLGWSGNGRCLATREPLAAVRLACCEADPEAGFLLGWVEETGGGRSVWLRAVADAAADPRVAPAAGRFGDLLRPDCRHFTFAAQGRLQNA